MCFFAKRHQSEAAPSLLSKLSIIPKLLIAGLVIGGIVTVIQAAYKAKQEEANRAKVLSFIRKLAAQLFSNSSSVLSFVSKLF